MMTVRSLILAIGFTPLFTGCLGTGVVEEIEIKTQPKLVVVGFLSPQDTVLRISVRKSYAIGQVASEDSSVVSNAEVSLIGKTNGVKLSYNPQKRWYESSAEALPILVGATYQLVVKQGDFPEVNVACTVPKAAPVPTFHYEGGDKFTVSWPDAADQANFYRVFCHPENPALNQGYQVAMSWINGQQRTLLADANVNGTIIYSPEGKLSLAVLSSGSSPIGPGSKSPTIEELRDLYATVDLLNTDEGYYRYHRSVLSRSNQENPFTEPEQPYSNIPNALGVFAAYNRTTIRVKIK